MSINSKSDSRKRPSYNTQRLLSKKNPINMKSSNSERKPGNNSKRSISKNFKSRPTTGRKLTNRGLKSKKKPRQSKKPMTEERLFKIIKDSKRHKFYGDDKTGAICIKNLPHGFYESSLKSFLSQFGAITRCKVGRSNKNASPMGFAYIEFQNYKVAKIVQRTMDNYLMFNKLLKCRFIPHDEIQKKMFSNYNLKKEFCHGTKKKLQNQYKMESGDETALKTKLQRKAEASILLLSQALKMEVNDLRATSSKQAEKDESELVENDSLIQIQASGMDREERKISVDASVQKEKKPIKHKGKIPKTDQGKEIISEDTELLRTPKRKKPRADVSNGQTPIVMEIEEVDEEIILKTPPNVIKVIKRGKQKVLCDGTATTVKRPLKKMKIQPSRDVATKLFQTAEEDTSSVAKKLKKRKSIDNKSADKTVSPKRKETKTPKKTIKLSQKEKSDTLQNSLNKNTANSRTYLKAKSVSGAKIKVKKGGTDFTSLLTTEKCENISEGKAKAELKKRKRSIVKT